MTVVIQLINRLNDVGSKCEKLKTAEKAEAIEIRAEAEVLFKACYAEFNLMQETVNNIQSADKLLSELHVLVAECAFKTENYTIARSVVEKFLQLDPQQDHLFCRAKVLLGLLINFECRHMNGNESIKWHKYAVAEIMAAFDVAVNPKNVNRYKFMIFNISVAFWKVVHPFLRPNRAKFFVTEMKRVVAALEEQNDADKEWRIMYLSAAAVCCEDEKNVPAATENVDKAVDHADALLQVTLLEEERLNGILKAASAEKDSIMIAFRQIEDQEILRNKPRKIDPDAPPRDPNAPPTPRVLPALTGLAAEGYDRVKSLLEASQARKATADADLRVIVDRRNVQLEALLRLYLQRVSVNAGDAKRYSTLPQMAKYLRVQCLVTVQCMLVGAIPDKEWEVTFQGLVKKLAESPVGLPRNETLADVARAAWRLKLRKIAIQCADLAMEGSIVSKILKVKTDICLGLKGLSDLSLTSVNEATGNRLSQKQSEGFFITKRIEAIKTLESALLAAGKIDHCQFLCQEVCLLMWNAMIPLLQPHLRARMHGCLKNMAACLRNVASPLQQLRFEVHAELAKCEDAANAVPTTARDEARRAVACDYGVLDQDGAINASNQRDGPSTIATAGLAALPPNEQTLDRNRYLDVYVLPYLNLLELRCLQYDSPPDIEGQALLWLHSAKESKLKPFIEESTTKALFLMLDVLKFDYGADYNGVHGSATAGAGANSSAALPSAPATTVASEESKSEASPTQALPATTVSVHPNTQLKRNAAGLIDFNALVAAKGPMVIPAIPIEELEKLALLPRTPNAAAGGKYTPFTPMLQLHCRILYAVANLGHLLGNVNLLQHAARFLLQPVWDPADIFVRELLDMQVHVQYLLADNILVRIKALPFKKVPKEGFLDMQTVEGELNPAPGAGQQQEVDPRCLGYDSSEVSEETRTLKRLVVQFLQLGLAQAVSVKDTYALQNGIIYFWNLHVHLFRHGLYTQMIPEIPKFLTAAIAAVDTLLLPTAPAPAAGATPSVAVGSEAAPFDHRLRLSLLETLSSYYEAKGMLAEAIDAASKGTGTAAAAGGGKPAKGAVAVPDPAQEVPEYLKKKICEQYSRLVLLQASSGGAGKGGAKAGEMPTFGNAFLNVYAVIIQAEQPAPLMTKDTAVALVNRAVELLAKDVEADLSVTDFAALSQERFSQLVEMQVEAWTRLTRLRMLFGDTIGSQYTAEKCLGLVAAGHVSPADEGYLNPRVWRWISVCERYFGLAVADIIQPTGQDLALQCDLRFVALDHFVLACDNAIRAHNEQLVVDAAANAWNISSPLVDLPDCRDRLQPVQRRILDALIQCKGAATSVRAAVDKLRQQFFLAMIEGYANIHDWDAALKVVMEAFHHVSTALQKPLWQWRVITLSKKGKSVLDGIQKLKESDPSLQAQVYGILARASSNVQQQQESYQKAIEILSAGVGKVERVDYMLEFAQWMGTNGVPSADISLLLEKALAALYEVERQGQPSLDDASQNGGGDDADAQSKGAFSQAGTGLRRAGAGAGAGAARTSGFSGTRGSQRSVPGGSTRGGGNSSEPKFGPDGKPIEEEKLPPRLDFKMLEQSARVLTMQSMLEANQMRQTAKSLEAVGYLQKGLELWMSTLYEQYYRKQAYAALKPEQRGECPFPPAEMPKGLNKVQQAEWTAQQAALPPPVTYPTIDTFHPPRPDYLAPPEDAILLVPWLAAPAPQLVDLMLQAAVHNAADVPSRASLPVLQLSVHYWLTLADTLRRNGHSKSALFAYSFVRLILLYLKPGVTGVHAVLSAVHFECFTLLLEMGLPAEAHGMTAVLPVSEPAAAGAAETKTGAADAAPLSIGAYLAKFVTENTVDGTKTQRNAAHEEAKPASLFGFSTWTPVLSYAGGFEVTDYLLQVSRLLLQLGQVAQCHSLTLTLEKIFTEKHDERSLIQCTSLLAKVALLNGKHEDVVAMLLARRPEMDRAGDSKELATHTELLMLAYARLDNPEEAREVGSLSLQLLEDVSLKMIDRSAALTAAAADTDGAPAASAATLTTVKGSGIKSATNLASRSTLTSVAGSQSRSQATLPKKAATRKSSGLVVEQSAANASAYYTVLRAYVSLQLQGVTQALTDGADPRPIYHDFSDRISRCADLVSDVTGDASTATANVLALRTAAMLDFLLAFHQRASSLVTPVDSYGSWLTENLQACQESASRLVDLYQKLAQGIPNHELSFTTEKDEPPPAPGAAPAVAGAGAAVAPTPVAAGKGAPTAAAAAPIPAPEEVEPSEPPEPPKLAYRVVSNPITRGLALAQMQLAFIQVLRAVLQGEHVSTTVNAALNEMRALAEMTSVERYLYDTRPQPPQEFVETRLMKAGQLLDACLRHLSNPETPGVVLASAPPADVLADAELLRAAAAMLQHHRDGVYDCMWGDPVPIPLPEPTIKVTDSEDQTLTGTVAPAAVPVAAPAPAPDAKGKAPTAGKKGTAAPASVVIETVAPPEPQFTEIGDKGLSEDAAAARAHLTEHARAMVVKYSASHASGASLSAVPVTSEAMLGTVPSLRLLHYACIALIESYGKHRSATAAMWLLQLQSAQASAWLRSVWRDYALNPTSAVAASVSRLEELCGRGWPVRGALQRIAAEQEFLANTSVAYKRLSFAADPLDILRTCPTNLVFLCLQYCPVHQTLYACAGLRTPPEEATAGRKGSVTAAKGAPAPAAVKGGAAAAATVPVDNSPVKDAYWVIDKMVLAEASRRSLQIILAQHKAWLAESSKFVITYGTAATTDCDLEGTTSNFESKNYRKAERALEEKLRALVADLELVMAPLVGPDSRVYALLQALLTSPAPTTIPAPAAADAVTEGITPEAPTPTAAALKALLATLPPPGPPVPNPGVLRDANASLQLLVDPTLQTLPWEATQVARLFNGRVCRDFSLHMLGHRMATLSPPPTAPAAPATGTAAAAAAAAQAAAPTAPVVNVTASALKYLVDPMQEDTFSGAKMPGLERESLSEVAHSLVAGSTVQGGSGYTLLAATHSPIPGAAKWSAVRSKNGTASLQDFIVSIDAATPGYVKAGTAPPPPAPAPAPGKEVVVPVVPPSASLLTYTLGRLSGILPPVELANLDLRQLALLLCLDQSQNDTSSRRQMSADVLKTPRQIASEQPLMVTALASLSGVGSLLVQTWSTPTNAQTRFLRQFMRKFATPAPVANTRTLLASVAHAGTTPAAPTSSATKAVAAPGKRGVRRSILRTNSEDSAMSDMPDTGVDAAESVASVASTVTAATATGAAAVPTTFPVKKWVRYARVVYGVPYVTYSEN